LNVGNIPNTSTTKLLKVLKTHHCFDKSLPSDAKTLFKTVNSNRGIQIRSVSLGLYYHFGIANGIHNYYKKYISSIDDSDIILVFGIDDYLSPRVQIVLLAHSLLH